MPTAVPKSKGTSRAIAQPMTGVAGPSRSWPPLPRPLTPFIGREHELAAVAGLVQTPGVRLVTLTGPGGAGKTRLALRAAERMREHFRGGAAFIAFDVLKDPLSVPNEVARALGVRAPGNGQFAGRLADSLRGEQLLLVLDNFEHLLEAAPFVADLLEYCPDLTVIVSSRAPLRISGEHVFAVPPLEIPYPDDALELLVEADAVRLFADRAWAADSSFTLTADNTPAVARLCARLDGLPLAIELAAAKTRLLSPQALLARLDRRLPMLVGGAREHPERLRTMRSAIAWSYGLLNSHEQALFRDLSVFEGGFTLNAAAAIVCRDDIEHQELLALIEALVDQSLIHRLEPVDGEPRFGMLETVRELALECLAASETTTANRERHAAWFAAWTEQSWPRLWGPDCQQWLAALEADRANLCTALKWYEEHRDWVAGLRMAIALTWFWRMTGTVAEGRAWFARLNPEHLRGNDRLKARSLVEQGDLTRVAGDLEAAIPLLEAGRATARSAGDQVLYGAATGILGVAWLSHGDEDRAQRLLQEALVIARRNRAPDDPNRVVMWLENLATVSRSKGDFRQATERVREALALARTCGFAWVISPLLCRLGELALLEGDHSRAANCFHESLNALGPDGDQRNLAAIAAGLAGIAVIHGDAERAARLCGAVLGLKRRYGFALAPAPNDGFERALDRASSVLGRSRFEELCDDGARMPIAKLIDEVADLSLPRRSTRCDAEPSDHLPRRDLRLSPRERQVLRMVADGRSNQEIATALGITLLTTKTHVAHVCTKLGVPSRTAAAAYAHRHGLA